MRYDLEQANRLQAASEADPFTEGRYAQFAKHLGKRFAGKVLDVGCNTGRGGATFRKLVPDAQLDGVELVSERIDRISPGFYNTVHRGLLQDVPIDCGPYNALLMGELIEHVPYDTLDLFIEQSIRLLAPGGQIFLTTPNPHYLKLRLKHGTVLGDSHVSVHCPAALSQYLQWKGLTIQTVTGSGQVSGLVGESLPLFCYGSYLLIARN